MIAALRTGGLLLALGGFLMLLGNFVTPGSPQLHGRSAPSRRIMTNCLFNLSSSGSRDR